MENKKENITTVAGNEVNQGQIDSWKAKYQKVFCYEVDGKKIYFKQPDRKTIAAAGVIAKNDPMKYNEFVLANCCLGGERELLNDDSVFYGISQKIDELVAAKVGELKNL